MKNHLVLLLCATAIGVCSPALGQDRADHNTVVIEALVDPSLAGSERIDVPQTVPVPDRVSMTVLSGSYTVGAAGVFPNLKAAVDTLNASQVGAPGVTFLLLDASYTDSLLTVNTITYATTPQPVVIKPSVASRPF
jgi:predicted ThiF/HesA family dinucleotide-utilizing enzyme